MPDEPSALPRRERPTWDDYFLGLARQTARRSNCTRRQVGAVLVQGRHIRSTGYNGPPSKFGHCDEGACPRGLANTAEPSIGPYDDCVAVHAEANAIIFSDVQDREGASLFCTDMPCFGCAKLIANSGITEVVTSADRYDGWDRIRSFLQDCGVRVRAVPAPAS